MRDRLIFFLITFSLILSLTSCSLVSKEDYEAQAKAQIDRLSQEFEKIQDLQTLQLKKNILKKRFLKITNLMMDYHLFLEKQPELKTGPSDELVLSANHFKSEFQRLFEIEGAIDLIIEIEKDSFLKLTLMEESLNKG